MKKLKIAQITPRYYPSIGGVERVVQELSEELVKKGHQVDVITTYRTQKNQKINKIISKEKLNGVNIYRFKSLFAFGHMSFTPFAIIKVLKNNYDIIHLHSLRHPHTIWVPLIKPLKKYKIILQGHSHFISNKIKTKIYELFDKFAFNIFYKNIDIFLALNSNEVKKIKNYGVDENKLFLLYNPIKQSLFQKIGANSFIIENSLTDKKKILFLGQAHAGKRIDLIIKALPTLIKRIRNIVLLIAGPDYGNYPNFKKLALELRVFDHIRFLGEVDESTKELILKGCDVLVLPSEYEAFGVVLAEAMACRKPVIATKTPGPLEIIKHGFNGFLIEKNSTDQLIDYLVKLLTDDDLAKILGKNAYKYALENFNIHSVCEKLEKIYLNLLKNDIKN